MMNKGVIESGDWQKTEEKNGVARQIFKAEIEHDGRVNDEFGLNDRFFRTLAKDVLTKKLKAKKEKIFRYCMGRQLM